jgi:hypothetical protein
VPVFLPAAFAATTAFTVAGVAVTYGALATAATLIASVGYSNYARRKAERASLGALQDRTFPIRASDAPQTIIYGETRVSGVIIYGASHDGGTDLGIDDEVTLVYALAGHELSAINDVWLNDKTAGTLDGNGEVTLGSDWYKSERVGAAEEFTPSSNSQTLTLSEAAPVESIDSVAWINDSGGGEPDRSQRVARFGIDYTTNAGAKTVTLIDNGQVNFVGVPLVVTYTATRGQSKARIRKFLGLPAGEPDEDLEDWTEGQDAPWTALHIGRGIPRLHVTHRWDDTIYTSGVPAASAIVRGKKVYNPRQDSTNGGSGSQRVADPTTWTWSNNPALCASDYLMSPLGFNVSATKIDWPSVIAAANACDEVVNSTSRYKCDGVLSTDASRKANLEAILSAMVGSAYDSGGKWYIRAGVANTATPFDLDESDLAGGEITVIARQPRSELFNAIRGRFRDPQQLYAITDFPPYTSSTYAAQDNGEIVYTDIELPMTQSAIAAQRIAKLILNRARQAVTVVADFKLGAYKLQPGDTVNLTLSRYGFSSKLFRVIEREFADLARVRLVLQEEAPAVYAWDFDADATTIDPAPNTNLPDPRYVAPPTNVALISTPTSFYTRSDGTAVPYLDITWDEPTSPDVVTELFYKRAEQKDFQLIRTAANATTARIEGVSGGDVLNLYLVHVSSTGARSTIWWVPSYTLDPTLPANGAKVGVVSSNLLANAAFEYSTDRWGNIFGNATFLREPSYPVRGVPSNARLQILDTATGTGQTAYVISDAVPVEAGQRYAAYCDLIAWAVDSFVALYWYTDQAGLQTISGVNSNFIAGASGDGASTRRPNNLGDYQRASIVATAPAGARYARLFIAAGGTWQASDQFGAKYVFAVRPFVGQVPLGTSELPPWDSGGSPVVGTAGIAAGAATNIVESEAVGPALFSAGSGLFLEGPSFIADAAGTVEATVTFTTTCINDRADRLGFYGGLLLAASGETSGIAVADTPFATLAAAAGGVNASDVVGQTLTRTRAVSAGQTITARLFVDRRAIDSIANGGIVEKTVTSYPALGSVARVKFRLTFIKR